eukprot:6388040-Lingulodinium_polyedra.AAC.1
MRTRTYVAIHVLVAGYQYPSIHRKHLGWRICGPRPRLAGAPPVRCGLSNNMIPLTSMLG